MRNQLARGAFAACLAAGAAAAQAPASEDNRIGGLRSDELRASLYEGWGEVPQDDQYSLHSMFQQNHGDFMNRRERFRPQIDLRASFLPNQRIRNEQGHFDQAGYGIDVDAPILVSPDGYLKFGFYGHGRSYQFSDQFGRAGNGAALPDDSLFAAGLVLGFGVFLDHAGNILFECETRPGAWSDLDGGLHHEDFDFPSWATLTFRAMDSLFFKVGARYNQVYEDAPWLPIVGMNWEPIDGFRFDLELPEHVEFSFWPSPSTGILLGAEVTGAEYHVRSSLADQENSPPAREDLRVQEIIAYLGLIYRMNDFTSLSVRGGAIVAGDYDLTSGQNGFNNVEGTLSGTVFAEVSFGVNF